MIYLVILLLGLLLAANHALSKNFLYPPALFTGVWLVSIIGLMLSGDTFYAVSAEALLVYVIGALAFSIGGLIVLSRSIVNNVKRVSFSPKHVANIHRMLDLMLLLIVIGLPFYIQSVAGEIDFSDPLALASQRMAATEASDSNQRSFDFLKNFGVLSLFLAMAMHYENDGSFPRKWRSYVVILLAIIYGGITGTKGNIINLAITLSFMSFVLAGKINFKILGSVIALALVFFAVGLFFVNFAYMNLDTSMDSIGLLLETIQGYWLGGLIAFDRVVQSPDSLISNQNLNRFFLETANGFGASFSLPSLHADYTSISSSVDTNVYTLYFSYFKDYGWFGLVLGMSVLGGILTWIYGLARCGRPLAVFFYGMSVFGIIFSLLAEHFVLSLNLYIKMFIFFYVVYYGSARLSIGNYSSRGRRNA